MIKQIKWTAIATTCALIVGCSGGATRPDGSTEPSMIEGAAGVVGGLFGAWAGDAISKKTGVSGYGQTALIATGGLVGALAFGKLARYFSEQDKKNAQVVLSDQSNVEKPVSWCGTQQVDRSIQNNKAKVRSTCPSDKPVITLTAHKPVEVNNKVCQRYKTEVLKDGKTETEELDTCASA